MGELQSHVFKVITCAAVLLFFVPARAQNIIPNAGFEEKKYCPVTYNQRKLKTSIGWRQAGEATPDHYDACNTKLAGVPSNIAGEQTALEGNAYMGLVTYARSKKNYREYLQTKLKQPLSAGQTYCFEIWVSCGDLGMYVTDGFGAHFSKTAISQDRESVMEVKPQFRNPRLHILDQTDSWVKLSDVFTASGGEQYITLGSFDADHMVSTLQKTSLVGVDASKDWAYLYIDDMVLKPVESKEECSCLNDKIREEVHDPPLQLSEVKEVELQTVFFAFDDSTLDAASKVTLDRTASLMRKNQFLLVRVKGHTDIVGPEGHNQKLSANRAKAVLAYLKDQGVDPKRLEIEWFGSAEPIANNDTQEGRAQNRRVDFALLERQFVEVVD